MWKSSFSFSYWWIFAKFPPEKYDFQLYKENFDGKFFLAQIDIFWVNIII